MRKFVFCMLLVMLCCLVGCGTKKSKSEELADIFEESFMNQILGEEDSEYKDALKESFQSDMADILGEDDSSDDLTDSDEASNSDEEPEVVATATPSPTPSPFPSPVPCGDIRGLSFGVLDKEVRLYETTVDTLVSGIEDDRYGSISEKSLCGNKGSISFEVQTSILPDFVQYSTIPNIDITATPSKFNYTMKMEDAVLSLVHVDFEGCDLGLKVDGVVIPYTASYEEYVEFFGEKSQISLNYDYDIESDVYFTYTYNTSENIEYTLSFGIDRAGELDVDDAEMYCLSEFKYGSDIIDLESSSQEMYDKFLTWREQETKDDSITDPWSQFYIGNNLITLPMTLKEFVELPAVYMLVGEDVMNKMATYRDTSLWKCMLYLEDETFYTRVKNLGKGKTPYHDCQVIQILSYGDSDISFINGFKGGSLEAEVRDYFDSASCFVEEGYTEIDDEAYSCLKVYPEEGSSSYLNFVFDNSLVYRVDLVTQ